MCLCTSIVYDYGCQLPIKMSWKCKTCKIYRTICNVSKFWRSNFLHLSYLHWPLVPMIETFQNINYRLFKPPFHTTVDGNTIAYSSMQHSMLANYDTKTKLFNEIQCVLREHQWVLVIIVHRIQYIKLLVYKGRTFL